MREPVVRGVGLVASLGYAAVVAWLYATQPQNVAQVTGGFASIVGAYNVDPQSFADGLRFFRGNQFVEARAALLRADPAERDAPTQFYIAYAYYREGWGRLYNDDALFGKGYIRKDGRKIHPLYLLQVKAPDESKSAWDLLKVVATIKGEDAFRPEAEGNCKLVKP
jgi:hypothetical protein